MSASAYMRRLPRKPGPGAMYRLGVASRAIAAIFGGYVLAALGTALMSLVLPMDRVDAVVSATMLSFTVYTCAVVWVFAARSAARAWFGLAVPGAAMAALTWAVMQFGGGAA